MISTIRAFKRGYEKGKKDAVRDGWISVEDALPPEKGEYIVAYHSCYHRIFRPGFCVGLDTFLGKTAWAKRKYQRVTHWQPLPEPPQMDEQEGAENG